MSSAQYLECTASSYDKLGFKYPSPEHNLEAFRPNYKTMKLQLSVPELSTSAPCVGDNEGLGTVHTERTFEMLKWHQKSKLRPTRQIIRLSVIRNTRWVKTVTFSHRKALSQRIDTWQPTDRAGTMPSWTEPTLDQLIIRFNARNPVITSPWSKINIFTLHST